LEEFNSSGKALDKQGNGNIKCMDSLLFVSPSPMKLKARNVGSLRGEERKKVTKDGLQGRENMNNPHLRKNPSNFIHEKRSPCENGGQRGHRDRRKHPLGG
jgi:hypothetical protein